MNNYLLRHPDVVDYISVRGDKCGKPVAVFLMFDQRTEELCDDLGLDIWFPPAKLRQRCDNKIETVRIGEKAGVPSVPNALAEVKTYQKLRAVAKKAGLGKHLVVQTGLRRQRPHHVLHLLEDDWDRHEAEIVAEPEVKVMKRIDAAAGDPRGVRHALRHRRRAAADRDRRLAGADALPGGWAGNELFPGAFTEASAPRRAT